jgi:DGQHR domain-containing protein
MPKASKPKRASKTVSSKKKTKKRRQKLTPQQKEQNLQKKEIRALLGNIGFSQVSAVDGKEFVYDGRTTELDDVFYYENVIIIMEYTIGSPSIHLLKKKVIYDKINSSPADFLKFLLNEKGLKVFSNTFNKNILTKYTLNQLQVRIIYASKQTISAEHKGLVKNIKYFDLPIVKYFESISKVIKRTSKFEFFDFLDIDFSLIGDNVKLSSSNTSHDFSGHILPEEHSSFKEGYKIVSFYIDAESLLKRAYVLRKDGWRNKENIGHYQRMFVGKKIRSMRKYLHEQKRVFINNIIVTLPVNRIKIYDEKGTEIKIDDSGNFKHSRTKVLPAKITIENRANIIGIIDGQHRTYAYHEGDDVYEGTIASLRNIQNLLITGILYPKNEIEEKRIKFESQLFLEINSTQSGASSQLKQEIEYILNAFSTTAISKHILNKLNQSGPLAGMFEEYWYEKNKIKTASIISFGLKPLVKLDGNDSLFKLWRNPLKNRLKGKAENYKLLNAYKEFCVTEVRKIFIGLKANLVKDEWKLDRKDTKAVLNVTTINGVINCLRILIENNKIGDEQYYTKQFSKISGFNFKNYKSSQYRKMGEDIYNQCFK